jgi:branched-subunit amino acid ABC-type transport system permease component
MSAGRAGAKIEIAADGVFVVMGIMGVAMFAIGQMAMAVRVSMLVSVRVAMHRPVLVHMAVLMAVTLDFHFPRTAAANRTHRLVSCSTYSISISLTRISVPPVGCTW